MDDVLRAKSEFLQFYENHRRNIFQGALLAASPALAAWLAKDEHRRGKTRLSQPLENAANARDLGRSPTQEADHKMLGNLRSGMRLARERDSLGLVEKAPLRLGK
jgi:hypothetical protein